MVIYKSLSSLLFYNLRIEIFLKFLPLPCETLLSIMQGIDILNITIYLDKWRNLSYVGTSYTGPSAYDWMINMKALALVRIF